MIAALLILITAALQAPQPRHPVQWTEAVGPNSRQELQARLKRPVKLPRGQKIYQHTDPGREIRTCADYRRAKKDGWSDSANTLERTTESFFKDQCDVPLLVLAARPSRVSYVRNFKLDQATLDLLPPSLSWMMGDREVNDAERQGLSWKKFKPGLKVREKYKNGIGVEEPDEATINLEIKAFGDFNSDGIEDILLFKSTHIIGGTARNYYPVILTRTAAGGPLKAFEVADEEIEKAVARVSQSTSRKPTKSHGSTR